MKGKLNIFLLIFVILFSTSCARQPKQGEPGGDAPTVVTLWHSLKGSQGTALQTQLDQIEKNNPQVIVISKYVPESDMVNLAYEAAAGGQGPELFIARREVLAQLYEKGLLAPVIQYTSDAYPQTSALFRYNNKLYAQPWLTDVPLLFFTKGLTPPASLAELFQTNNGGLTLSKLSTQMLSTWWNAQGGSLWAGNQPSMDSPGNLFFVQQLLSWQTAHTLQVNPDALNLLAKGQIPYTIGWASQIQSLNKLKVAWDGRPLSDLTGGQGKPMLGTTLGIANSTIKVTDTSAPAIQIVEEALITPEVEGAIAKTGVGIPVDQKYYSQAVNNKQIPAYVGNVLSSAQILSPDAPEWQLIPLQDSAWTSVLTEGQDPQLALTEAQTQALKLIK